MRQCVIAEDQEETLAKAKEGKEKATASVKDLQYKVKNSKALREKELKEAENATSKAKKTMENSQKKMKQKQQVLLLLLLFIIFCN